jgi:hypothetical protein
MKTIESLQKAKGMVWAIHYGLADLKERMGFAPIELSKAIGSLSEAQRQLEKTIAKLNVK